MFKSPLALFLGAFFMPVFAHAAYQESTVDTNETVLVAEAAGDSDKDTWKATICATGTWSSGTLTFYLSPDRGTTKPALTDLVGSSISLTSDGCFGPVELGKYFASPLQIYATMSGATSPNIKIATSDNNR